MLHDMFVRILSFVFDFQFNFLIASSSTVYSISWTVMSAIGSVVILSELLYPTLACSWKIGIANPPYLVGKDSNLRSSSLYTHPSVIADMDQFRMVSSIGMNKLQISEIVLMKWLILFLKPLTNIDYAGWDWLSATVDKMHSWLFQSFAKSSSYSRL